MSDLGLNSLLVTRAAPGLDPVTVHGIASSGTPDPTTVAGATQGFSDIQQLSYNLSQQSTDVQKQHWNSLDDSTRRLLTAGGYKPPKSHFGSVFGQVLHDVTHNDVTDVAGEGLNVLGAPLRAVQHVERAALYQSQLGDLQSNNGLGGLSAISPQHWMEGWRATTNGEKTYNPQIVSYLTDKYGESDVELAKQLASGTSPDDLMRATPPDQQPDLFTKLQSPQFRALTTQVDQSHISLGRSIGHALGLMSHPGAYRWVSGIADGIADIYGDPLIIAGKANKAYNAGRFAIEGADDVHNLYNTNAGVQRAMGDIASTADANGPAGIINRYPNLAPIADELAKRGAGNPDEVANVFAEKADALRVLRGQGIQGTETLGQNVFGIDQVPRLNPVELAKLNATSTVKSAIDTLADSDSALGSRAGGIARKLTTLTTQVSSIRPNDPNSNLQIKRYLDSFLPASTSDELVNQYLSAPTEGAKANIYLSINKAIMDSAGIPEDAQQRMIGKLRDVLNNTMEARGITGPGEAYGTADTSLMQTDKGTIATALHGPQVDDVEWAMPSYRELRRAAANTTVLQQIGSSIESPALDTLIEKIWKPSVLLRMGFPVRAGGEELASAMIREGMGPIRGRLAASSVLGQGRAQELTDAKTLVNNIVDKLQTAVDHFNAGNYDSVIPGQSFNDPDEMVTAANRHIEGLSSDLTKAQTQLAQTAGDHLLPAINVHPFSWMLDHLRPDNPDGKENINFARDLTSNGIHTARDLYGAVVGGPWDRLHDASLAGFRTLQGTLAGGKYTDAAKELYDMFGDSMLSDTINAARSHGGYWETAPGFQGAINKGARGVRAYLEPTGNFKEFGSADPTFVSGWLRRLREVSVPGASDPGRVALQTAGSDMSLADRVSQVADALDDPKYAGWRSKFMRATQLSDGRIVGPETTDELGKVATATTRDASEDWAQKIIKDVDSLVHGQDGTFHSDIRDQALNAPTKLRWQDLQQIPVESRPIAVNAPEWVIHPISHWQSMIDTGFDGIVGRPMNWLARQGQYLDAYVSAKSDLAPALKQLQDAGISDAEGIIQRTAAQQAVDNMLPYIHDPTQRSQFSVITRNLIPFWFAQEQFYKRWARTIADSPDGFRKAQILMNGIEHSGFVHTDDQGNKYFMYPGADIANKTLAHVFQTVTGQPVTMPLPVGFKGELRFVNPGVEHATSLPSPSPIVALPLTALTNMFPELAPVEQTVEGRGAGLSYWEQVTPPSVARFVHALNKNPDSDPQLMSAMSEAMKWAAANGKMPTEQLADGTPNPDFAHQQEQFNARVRDQARVILLSRAMLGFVAPASPELAVGSPELNTELQTLMGKGMSYSQALQTFLSLHPNASAYTVFKSSSVSGAPLPATAKAAQFMADNEDFLKKFPQAGGWFIPQGQDDTGGFSSAAWREQMALQLRERKTFQQVEDDIYHSQAAGIFYKQKDLKDQMVASAHGASKQRIQNSWDQWSQSFLQAHPIFAQDYMSSTGMADRSIGVNQINTALKDPALPSTAQTQTVRNLMDQYNQYRAVKNSTAGLNSSIYRHQRDNAKTAFVQFARGYIEQHPEVQPLYDKMIRPDVEGTA